MLKRVCAITMLCLALSMSGCLFEQVSWSPDGRYVVFTSGSDEETKVLWRWDSETGRTEELVPHQTSGGWFSQSTPIDEKVFGCRYLPSGKKVLLMTEGDDGANIYLMDPNGRNCNLRASDVGPYIDVSKSGEKMYYVSEDSESDSMSLWVANVSDGEKERLISLPDEIGFPKLDPTESRVLLSTEEGKLLLLELDTVTPKELLADDESAFYHPLWVDEETILYLLVKEENNDDLLGDLYFHKLDGTDTRLLCKDAYSVYPFGLSPDGKSAVLTVVKPDSHSDAPAPHQAARVELSSGKLEWLTDTPFGAFSPAISPDGKRLAFLTVPHEEYTMLEVLDIESGLTSFAWRNDEERLWSTAHSLAQAGDSLHALEMWRDLLRRYPDTVFNDSARFRIVETLLEGPNADLHAVLSNWREIEDPNLRGLAATMLFRESDRVAQDPAEDWIRSYGTEASMKEFQFNTDLTRDLRALWLRLGKEKVLIRVDYGHNRDLRGLAFQDTVLLFDNDSPGAGSTEITPLVKWDRAADITVALRHWYVAEEKSQYDVEIFGGEGETVFRYMASGFSAPANPVFDVVHIDDDTNSVIISISRKMLGLHEGRPLSVQVCTLKGGVESFKGLERPRENKTGFDVADAFGKENSAERIDAELEKGEKPIIKGVAATVMVE